MLEILLLAVAGFASGLLNAVAGGGTFISLPALIHAGIPPVSANATATLTALPGYVSSAWALRREMQAEGRLGLRLIIAVAAAGSVIGAILLVLTPGEAFLWIVPWLLLLATVLFAAGPYLLRSVQARGGLEAGPVLSAIAILAVSIYGGYFNGGLGIMLLAAFGLLGYVNLHGMNGLKNLLSAVLSLVSVLTFIGAGLIAWEQAFVMAGAATLGGYIGARKSRKIVRTDLLRYFVTGVGIIMTCVFFLK
ncbi:sulfite exporter TauE/SafE family protein [Roseibium sp.]|uniref:sulfite exporter TauE/SafE family protein n=1 Tax=Roseibium sp. TaxID=1936156 RepID=UPI003D10D1C9